MAQHIGKISKSKQVRVRQRLVNSDTSQTIDEIADSRDIDIEQASVVAEFEELAPLVERLLTDLESVDLDLVPDGELDLVEQITDLPPETIVNADAVQTTQDYLDQVEADTPKLRRMITDIGTATSVVTGGVTASQLTGPGIGVCASLILLVAGVLSADQVRNLVSSIRVALRRRG